MKKIFARVLTLALGACMLLSQTALAYTTYYIDLTITDAAGKSVSGQSGHYATLREPLAAAVVGEVVEQYNELETVFAKTGLRGIVDAGVEAFRAGDDAWRTYVDTYYNDASGAFKDILMDKSSTYADLTPGVPNVLTYLDEDDAMTYTLTITLRTWSGDDGEDDTYSVRVVDGRDSATLSSTSAGAGEQITVTAAPAEGYTVNQVTAVDAMGRRLTVTAQSDLVFVFTMPANSVIVNVTYKLAPRDPDQTGVSDYLITGEKVAYMQGKPDGLFYPRDSITRAEVATVFYRLLKDVDVEPVAPFEDVAHNAWYADAVNTLAALGIVRGMRSDTFEPDRPITRAQLVAICARFARTGSGVRTFEDVPADHWAADYISTAAGYGWVNGISDTEFAPDRAITRAEAAAMVNRVLSRVPDRGYIDSQPQRYEDVEKTNWAWYDISEASFGKRPR